jgi:hypothetical protein
MVGRIDQFDGADSKGSGRLSLFMHFKTRLDSQQIAPKIQPSFLCLERPDGVMAFWALRPFSPFEAVFYAVRKITGQVRYYRGSLPRRPVGRDHRKTAVMIDANISPKRKLRA